MRIPKTSILNCILFLLLPVSFLQAQEEVTFSNLQKDTLLARQFLTEEKTLTEAGSYEEALRSLEKAQDIYSHYFLWEEAVDCAVKMAVLSDNFDTADRKIKYADLALSLAKKHLETSSLNSAHAYRQKAEALMMLGKMDSANYYLGLSVPIFDQHQQWSAFSWSRVLLGVNYLNQSKFDSSQVHLQSVQKVIAEQLLSEEEQANINPTLLNLLGVLYRHQGDYDNAIQNTQQALFIEFAKPQLTAIDSFYIALHYNNLGAFYLTKGDYQRALDNFMQARYINQDASSTAPLLINTGALLIRQKKIQEAITYFKKALLIKDTKQNKMKTEMEAYNGLSTCFTELSQYDSALYYCQKAENLPLDFKKADTKVAMGRIYLKRQQAQLAIDYFNTALEISKSKASGNNNAYYARLYRYLGDGHFQNNEPETALRFYQQALINNHETFQDSLDYSNNPSLVGVYEPIYFLEAIWGKGKTLASFENQIDQLDLSLNTFQLAMQWADTMHLSYAAETTQLDWSSKLKQLHEDAIGVAYACYQISQEAKYLDLAFTFSERSKNVILLENLKSSEGKFYADVPDSLIQQERDLNLDIAFYEKSLRKAKQKEQAAKVKLYQQYLSKSRLELVALKDQIEKDYPKYQDWKYGGQTISIAKVQSNLVHSKSAFLEYFLGDSTIYAFVITKASARLLMLDSPQKVRNSVIDFRAALLNFSLFEKNTALAFEQYSQAALGTYQLILQPVISTLSPAINQLIIVPDGVVNTIPLEALVTEKSPASAIDFSTLPYLIHDYRLHYAYSADLLLKNQSQQKQIPSNIQCLALAPPYQLNAELAVRSNSEQRNAAGYLEGTANEIQQIAQFFEGQFDASITATEQKFKQSASDFGILHLAMHGVVDLDNANFNHLKFPESKASEAGSEDNLLHHYEIANMDLQAQLVVLSACETGVGKYEKGEGVFSLARSFMYAGVPSVVMSLWKVDDASTGQLMPYFYENLAAGLSKDVALHEAKLRFLKEAGLEYRHPYYWSAFVILGDTQEIRGNYYSLIWWGFSALFLGLIIWWFLRAKKT